MAATVGQLLEILAVPELAHLYESTIRKMQPAELVRRLASEKVSTHGHMPELRGRLLRLEAIKLHPQLDVPWYPEDFASRVMLEPAAPPNCDDDDPPNKFLRYRETQLRKIRSTARPEETTTDEACDVDMPDAVLDKLDDAIIKHLTVCQRRVDKPTALGSSAVETRDEMVDESQHIVDYEKLDEEIRKETNDESENKFDANLDADTRRNVNDESGSNQSSDSIVRISSDQESFEKLDEESTDSWDKNSWSDSCTTSVCMRLMNKLN